MRLSEVVIHDDRAGIDASPLARLVREVSGARCRLAPASLPRPGPLVFDGSPARMRPARGGEAPAAYDGFEMQRAARRLGPSGPGQLHVAVTGALCCTYDESDMRYHARPIVCANPAVISVPGILHGPARAREYHVRQVAAGLAGLPPPPDPGLAPGDARLPAAARAYLFQAMSYHATGEPFCSDPGCMAFNARRQPELLRAAEAGPCPAHRRALRSGLN